MKKNTSTISFLEYKSLYSFSEAHEDYFHETTGEKFGCTEDKFWKWLRTQRLFIKRYAGDAVTFHEVQMPEKKWSFFLFHYERSTRTHFLVNSYPSGYFECIEKGDDSHVACFLPEPSGDADKPYRLSFYRPSGPTYHEVYRTRTEALTYLANHGYKPCIGALDALVGTVEWDRGLVVTRWLSEGIHPTEGLKRDSGIAEVAQLFQSELKSLNECAL